MRKHTATGNTETKNENKTDDKYAPKYATLFDFSCNDYYITYYTFSFAFLTAFDVKGVSINLGIPFSFDVNVSR